MRDHPDHAAPILGESNTTRVTRFVLDLAKLSVVVVQNLVTLNWKSTFSAGTWAIKLDEPKWSANRVKFKSSMAVILKVGIWEI